MAYATAQEDFWAGDFGDSYVDRNRGEAHIAARTALWSQILRSCGPVNSITEFGANIGLNTEAFRRLCPALHCMRWRSTPERSTNCARAATWTCIKARC